MGHLWIWCIACDDEGREATFYEPPHDIAHREPGPWRPADPALRKKTRRLIGAAA
jgi:hypothetical protein